MKLFSLLGSNRYKPLWTYRTEAPLWRVLFSHGTAIAGERRIADTKEVTFFCIDTADGKELWTFSRRNEGWWTTTEGIYGNRLYLHAFAKPDLPHPKHITAVDIDTGRIVWERPEMTFLYFRDNHVVAMQEEFGITRYHRLDPNEGEIAETVHNRELIERERADAQGRDPHHRLTFPEPYTHDVESHEIYRPFIESLRQNRQLADLIEVHTYKHNVIVCCHAAGKGAGNGVSRLEHVLHLYDKNDRKLLYRDILYDNAAAPVPDGFFMRDTVLFYIRNRTELVALDLEDTR
jgi:hypothetical protein